MSDRPSDVESIFLAALDKKTPEERAAYLDEVCGDDAERHARVLALLHANDDAGSFLGKPPIEVAATAATDGSYEPLPNETPLDFLTSSDVPGHLGTLGQYEITEVVGQGGMGIVLKGHDPKLNRVIAIKVLAPRLSVEATARRRFLREAQAAAAVSHDHVVVIHAIDDSRQLPFLVMEYISGQSLQQRIDRTGPLQLKEILRIGKQMASGLAAAHAEGLIHRDVKPANILLENGVERVKITDFGLARAANDASMTKTGVVCGTPEYMSPEQAQGLAVDHRSDLFSLGCVLYAMCTGRSPFRADSAIAVIRRVCDDVPRPIREVNSEIPDWLAVIIDRLLAKDPDKRFQSAEEAATVLGQYLAHIQQSSRVPLPSPPAGVIAGPMPTPGGRHRRIAATAGAVCLALGLFCTLELTGITNAWTHRPEPAPAERPTRPRFHFVDFGPQAIRNLSEGFQASAPTNNLAALPQRVLEVVGIPLDIKSHCMQLSNKKNPDCPDAIRGIGVNRKAAKLHFLHGAVSADQSHGSTVAFYTMHYDDGSSETMPVVVGRHLRDWWLSDDHQQLTTQAKVAWIGTNPCAEKADAKIQLFLCPWENPHPEKTIVTIDFERGPSEYPSPFCLAITCDDDSTPLPPEQAYLGVLIGSFVGKSRYKIAVDGSLIAGEGRHERLLPAGRHAVEIRDDDTVVRRGFLTVEAGSRVDLLIDGPQALFPLPTAQPKPIQDLIGQNSRIRDAELSEDGKMLATSADDGTVVLWSLEGNSWTKRSVLPRCDKTVRSVAFSPNSNRLAVASDDGSMKLWNIATEKLDIALEGHPSGVRVVCFSPDGQLLASGNGDGTVDIWDITTHSKLHSFQAHPGGVRDLDFSPDGVLLATGGWGDTFVKLWDVASAQSKKVLFGHTASVASVAFSPDGKTLASAGDDSTAKLWSADTEKMLHSFGHPQPLLAVTFDPKGEKLAAAGEFHTVRIWDIDSHRVLHDFHAHWNRVRAVRFSPDGSSLFTAGDDNSTRVWPVAGLPGPFDPVSNGPAPIATFAVHEDWSMCAAFSPKTGNLLGGVGVKPFDLQIWDLTDFSRVAKIAVNEGNSEWMCGQSLLFSPDEGTLLACLTRKGKPRIALWEPTMRIHRGDIKPGAAPMTSEFSQAGMAMSADGEKLAVFSQAERLVSMVDLTTQETSWAYLSTHGETLSVAFSPNAEIVAVGTDSGKVILLNAATGEEIHDKPLKHGTEDVGAVAFSQEGMLVSADQAGVVKLWDLASLECIELSPTHRESICSATFSPNGRLLVTTSGAGFSEANPGIDRGEVCLWDMETRKLITEFHAHYGCVTSADFSPDGKTLATTGRDGKMHLWDVEELRRHVSRNPSSKHAGDILVESEI